MNRTIVSSAIGLSLILLTGAASGQTPEPAYQPSMKQSAWAPMSAGDITQVAMSDSRFTTLCSLLRSAGLVDALKGPGPFTVFAPTNEAFAKLPAGTLEAWMRPENKAKLTNLLRYHVLNGEVWAKDVRTMPAATLLGQRVAVVAKEGTVMIDKARVTQTDIKASNGVIHVVDTVLMPTEKDIVATAQAAGKFTILTRLLEDADWVTPLQGEGPFTVFAPTDDAFRKLPKETLDNLMKPENRQMLASILKYHVVEGRIDSDAAAKGAMVKTLEGHSVTTKSDGKKVWIDGATVTWPDIQASNGVIHVIDTVLMPK
jgi:uncharacterized surface protein with fasciclin (FAS1) repeats